MSIFGWTPHTRTSTPRGPDFCQECSAAVGDWVQWPCPATPATPAEVECGENVDDYSMCACGRVAGHEPDAGDDEVLAWGDMPYDSKTPAEVVHDYVVVRGDLSAQYARDQLSGWIERYVAARECEAAERAGERIARALLARVVHIHRSDYERDICGDGCAWYTDAARIARAEAGVT